jgi:hypothetical protein
MSWCYQCGAEGRPTRACGVDEDGEPACLGHALKKLGAGLNAAAGRVPTVPAPIQPAAAPSPVQTKAEGSPDPDTTVFAFIVVRLRSSHVGRLLGLLLA